MTIFILTRSHNAYDQYGAYYVACFPEKPTPELLQTIIRSRDDTPISIEEATYIIQHGGGRRKYEDIWYNLETEIIP